MKSLLARHPYLVLVVVVVAMCTAVLAVLLPQASFSDTDVPAKAVDQPEGGSVNVTQYHNHDSRDGVFIDPAFTSANAANLVRDTNFNGVISGNVYSQPLYVENGPGGQAMVIIGTESNNLYALNATTGNVIWQRTDFGTAATGLPCTNVTPEGIHGTPIVDLATRTLYLNVLTMPSTGVFRQMIYSLNVDTGATNAGWPVSVEGLASNGGGGITFTSNVQGERGALAIVGDRVYVPYGGRFGDCGNYHGWIVGVAKNNPADVQGWATLARGGGAWSVGGIASDGATPFLATGNTFSTGGIWQGGEAIIRFQPGPVFSGQPQDYWAPTNWLSLDNSDTDLGGTGAMLVDVPGATPSQLIVALGKDRNAYLLNRANLGGISAPVSQITTVSNSAIIQAATTYRTSMGTYVAFRGNGIIAAFRINAANPPTITNAWSVTQSGRGSPFVTSPDGTNDFIVWSVGSGGSQRLNGYNPDTGATIYAGGGANELMTGTRPFITGIVARGRIYVAADNRVYAFMVPSGGATPTPTPTPPTTPTPTPTRTPTPTPTDTPTPPIPTPTPTRTPTPTPPPTVTPSPFPELDLQITQADSPDPVVRGQDLTYTLTVINVPMALGGTACPVVRFAYPSGVPFTFISTSGTNGYVATPDVTGVTFSGGCLTSQGGQPPATATLTVVLRPLQFGTMTSLGSNVVVDPQNLVPESNENNNTAQTVTTDVVVAGTTAFDFDSDGRADVSVFRPSDGNWYMQRSRDGFTAVHWGLTSDKIVPADYDGDGKTDIAVFRPSEGNWYVLRSSNGTLFAMNFGIAEDLPSPGDFDQDGRADITVYRPSTGTWWISRSLGGLTSAQFGISTDKPVVGDWNGDGRADLGVFRPSNGTWYTSTDLVDPSHNFQAVTFGLSTDLVTPADFDGDHRTDIAVFRPSNGVWYWLSSANGNAFNAVQFGISEDIPTAADYDGDGRADVSVFRPSSGVWYRLNSSTSQLAAIQFGTNGDKPGPAAFRY